LSIFFFFFFIVTRLIEKVFLSAEQYRTDKSYKIIISL